MRIAVALGVVFAGMAALAQDADTTLNLRVMSFNVRYGTANDGANSWDHRKDILVETIKEAAPDVIGTQECLDFQADYVVERLPEYTWFGVGREADGSGEHMAVFYRKDTLTPLSSGHFWLSETPDVPGSMSWNTACTRMVTWITFKHGASEREFAFYNTHLDHKSPQARLEGAKLLAARLTLGDEPVILTGDFNCAGGSADPWSCLVGAGMADAWQQCATRSGPDTTWCGFAPPQDGRGRRIDWIMTRGAVKVLDMQILTKDYRGRYPSDHFPVVATLQLTNGVAADSPAR